MLNDKLAFLLYLAMFLYTIYEFPVKKEPNPPHGADHGRKVKVAELLGQRFLEEIQNGGQRFTLIQLIRLECVG